MVKGSNLRLVKDSFRQKSLKIVFSLQQTQNKCVLSKNCYRFFGMNKK